MPTSSVDVSALSTLSRGIAYITTPGPRSGSVPEPCLRRGQVAQQPEQDHLSALMAAAHNSIGSSLRASYSKTPGPKRPTPNIRNRAMSTT